MSVLATAAQNGVDALWRHVLARWGDAAAHQAFLKTCQELDLLAEAAKLYRSVSSDPAFAEMAHRQLAAIPFLALAQLETMRTVPRSRRPLLLGLVFLFLVLLGWGFWLLNGTD